MDASIGLCGDRFLNKYDLALSKSKRVVVIGEGYNDTSKYGEVLILPVELDAKEKEYIPNKNTRFNLILAWGKDTKGWVGKVIELHFIKNGDREYIIGYPATEKKETDKRPMGFY